jgi:hypothetical protein
MRRMIISGFKERQLVCFNFSKIPSLSPYDLIEYPEYPL